MDQEQVMLAEWHYHYGAKVGLVWLIGVVVCLFAANRGSSCSFTRAMDGHILRCSIISSCQSAATSEIIKALLVSSPSHERGTTASTGLYLYLYHYHYHYYTVSGKKNHEHYRLSLEEGLTNFNNFWHKHFWHNLPLNDRLFYHLTQCLFLHYLGKTEPTKYASKRTKIHQKTSQTLSIVTWRIDRL